MQDLYLQLDINNSIFETIIDQVSTGVDTSGSNYIVSSSYPDGNLVRSDSTTTNQIIVRSDNTNTQTSSY